MPVIDMIFDCDDCDTGEEIIDWDESFLRLDLQHFANDEEDDLDDDDLDEEEPKPKKKKAEQKGDDIPEWGKQILDLLKPNDQSNKGTAGIPVPKPPKQKEVEEDLEEQQKPKKRSFLEWLM